MSDGFLTLDEICVRYADASVDAVRDVSLTVATGEVVAILGSSGSGKSSLLRVICGLETARSGRVELEGHDITTMPVHRRGIGMMFQDNALFPHLDVAGNISYGLKVSKVSKIERSRRVDDVLDLVGLAGFGDRRVASLSGGEQQRVALARTLAVSPRVLLLDEPMGSLDRALRDRLLPDLAALIGELGLTAIYVTHDRLEALTIADRIAIMDEGRIVQIGTPQEVTSAPVSAHVAAILGEH